MLSRCFSFQSGCTARTWKSGHYLYELHVAETRDDGQQFCCRSVRHFSASSSELRPGVSGLPINLDDLWPYTSHLRARVRTMDPGGQPMSAAQRRKQRDDCARGGDSSQSLRRWLRCPTTRTPRWTPFGARRLAPAPRWALPSILSSRTLMKE